MGGAHSGEHNDMEAVWVARGGISVIFDARFGDLVGIVFQAAEVPCPEVQQRAGDDSKLVE